MRLLTINNVRVISVALVGLQLPRSGVCGDVERVVLILIVRGLVHQLGPSLVGLVLVRVGVIVLLLVSCFRRALTPGGKLRERRRVGSCLPTCFGPAKTVYYSHHLMMLV